MNYGYAKGLETRVFHKSFEQGAEYHLNYFLETNPNILIIDVQFELDAEGIGQILLVFRDTESIDDVPPPPSNNIPPPPPSWIFPTRTV